ncbi:unnamed protein product, partial [Ectocarpus sp. 13 AM-2016]
RLVLLIVFLRTQTKNAKIKKGKKNKESGQAETTSSSHIRASASTLSYGLLLSIYTSESRKEDADGGEARAHAWRGTPTAAHTGCEVTVEATPRTHAKPRFPSRADSFQQ